MKLSEIEHLLLKNTPCVLVTILSVSGSTPRNEGAYMVVSQTVQAGTIGGGQLEFLATEQASKILFALETSETVDEILDIPLGPELGQCCGGRVKLQFEVINDSRRGELLDHIHENQKHQPQVIIFGAGHVGLALGKILSLLPMQTTIVDTRPDFIKQAEIVFATQNCGSVTLCSSAIPETFPRKAEPFTSFVIATHDHGLDYMIAREALIRSDSAYVGMIGSKTKRANFKNWLAREYDEARLEENLICPIGGKTLNKLPEAIALATAFEIFSLSTSNRNPQSS